MLADIKYWKNDAQNKHYAIAHFNVWNAEMLMGVIDAAVEVVEIAGDYLPSVLVLWGIPRSKIFRT